MGVCQYPNCFNQTKGNRNLCSEHNKKITEKRLIKIVNEFDKFLIKEKHNNLRKKLWKTFKPLFSKRFRQILRQKGF
jgi:hypothetical protein